MHEDCILVPLSQDKVAVIDAEDAERVLAHKWSAFEAYPHLWYAVRQVGGRPVLMHRFILGVTERSIQVDHVDGDGLNNRRSNIRHATTAQNAANRGRQSNNTSGYKGVVWFEKQRLWHATIKVNGRARSLRYFKTAEEAALAYDEACREFFGEFCRPNFPNHD